MPQSKFPIEEFRRLYLEGRTLQEIGSRFETTGALVRYHLEQMGITLRPSPYRLAKARGPMNDDLLRELVSQKLSVPEIAKKMDFPFGAVEKRMRQLQLPSQHGKGSPMEKNYFWKGGRRIDEDGYVLVKSPGHPYATKSGYVREHRLVMEKKLGRYLLPTEVVHHKKEDDRANNNPENLELFETNADHLRHELAGKRPKWTPEGYQRILDSAQRKRLRAEKARAQKTLKTDGPQSQPLPDQNQS